MDKGEKKLKLKSSSNMTAAILLVLVLLVFATLLSERHYFRWDLTSTDEHSLSDKTIQVLKNVKTPVTIKAFVRAGFQEAEDAKRLLSAYRYKAPTITYELIDPEKNPAITRRYNVKSINTFVLEGFNRSQTIKIADEEHVTNALIRLIESNIQKVYWLTGHGERPFKGTGPESLGMMHDTLGKENYEFLELNLTQKDIPPDTSLVIVAAPVKQLFPAEITSLRKYLNRGGRVMLFLEPFYDGGLQAFLKSYGILITDDIIVDKMSRVMGGDYLLPMVANYGNHEITRDFRLTSLFEMARSVQPADEPNENTTVIALAFTSPNSWSETDRQSLDTGRVQFDKNDRQGPISLAAIAEIEPPVKKVSTEKDSKDSKKNEADNINGKGKLVVFGDVDFASNKRLKLAGNEDFITNTINYIVGRGNLITIKKKHKPVEPLVLTQAHARLAFWIPVVIMPLLVLVSGIVIWYRRRSR